MIERRIVIGLITSTEFLRRIRNRWSVTLMESSAAKRLASWCIDYYDKYNKAPNRDIEGIFYERVNQGLQKDVAEEIENDILPSLSEEYEQEGVNVDYLVDQTLQYFTQRSLLLYSDRIKALAGSGKLLEAESIASSFQPLAKENEAWIDLNNEESLNRVERAFERTNQVLISYPRSLGEFWNEQLVRGGFVALMASEKRGKTFWLLDLAMRGAQQNNRIAFFQAGDMTEDQQLKRICVYLSQKSDRKQYTVSMHEPMRDCVKNQMNDCQRRERECNFGVFEDKTEKEIRQQMTLEELKKKFKDNPDYAPCCNCDEYQKSKWGTIWLKKIEAEQPLTTSEAKQMIETFFIKHKRSFKLSTHVNGTLTVSEIRSILNIWERQEGFTPDVIVVDYADLLQDDTIREFRHKQNKIWMDLRGLSQERHSLVLTATQADADSYVRDLLGLNNFSEDKRKYGHVTAMYGLNQDHVGREKELGIMRINEIVVREGDFNNTHLVHVMQNLRRGRPFLGSYW